MPLRLTSFTEGLAVINRWADKIEHELSTLTGQVAQTQKTVKGINGTLPDLAIPPDAVGVSASENGYTIDGVVYSEVSCTYTCPAPKQGFAGVFLVASGYRGSSELVKLAEHHYNGPPGGSATFKATLQRTGETITLCFVAKNDTGVTRTNWADAPSVAITLDGNATAPNAPVGVSATSLAIGIALTWTQNSESNLAGYKIYRNTSNSFGTATLLHNLGVTRSGNPSHTDLSTALGTYYYYWITAVNTANQESAPSTVAAAAPGGAGATSYFVTGTFGYTSTTTSLTLYWDGTNLSVLLTVKWPDGTTTNIPGSSISVTGLTAGTTYKFYPYFDIATNAIAFVAGGTGTPAIAHTTATVDLLQSQMLPGRVPLTDGPLSLATPTSGTGGGSNDGCPKHGSPFRQLIPGPVFLLVEPETEWIELTTPTRQESFSPKSRLYCRRGLLSADELQLGDLVVTEAGEEPLIGWRRYDEAGLKDHYVSVPGHIHFANGFMCHNRKAEFVP